LSNKRRLKLALAVFAKNEEDCIKACIESCKGVDHVVVVDTGSTDRTKEIAAACGAKVYDYAWHDDYGAARTYSLRCCPDWIDWIISLDADEQVEKGGIETIRKTLEVINADPDFNACQILLCNIDQQEQTHWFERVVRNKPSVFYSYPIDECYIASPTDKIGKITDVKVFYKVRSGMTPEKHLALVIDFLRLNPNEERMQYVAGRRYYSCGDCPSAVYWFERYIRNRQSLGLSMATPQMVDALFFCAYAHVKMLEFARAKELLTAAWQINNDFRDACLLMSKVVGYEGDKETEQVWLNRAFKANNTGLVYGPSRTTMVQMAGP
jgi:glycosyltransferase involved in cell wall biosynthesis